MTALTSCVFLLNYKPTLFSLSCKTFRTLLRFSVFSQEEMKIRHGGIEKFFGTLISFFRTFISFFRTFISRFRREFSFVPRRFPISSVGDGFYKHYVTVLVAPSHRLTTEIVRRWNVLAPIRLAGMCYFVSLHADNYRRASLPLCGGLAKDLSLQ